MRKLYSIKGYEAEECFLKEYFIEMLKEDENKTFYILQEWHPVIGGEEFWCGQHNEPYESTKGVCGKFECTEYAPRNGKSGCCKHRKNCFEPKEKFVTIKK